MRMYSLSGATIISCFRDRMRRNVRSFWEDVVDDGARSSRNVDRRGGGEKNPCICPGHGVANEAGKNNLSDLDLCISASGSSRSGEGGGSARQH